MELFTAGEYTAVRELAEPHAQCGVADAECMMGLLFQLGAGVRLDGQSAVYWYRKAAGQGHAIALDNLGTIYLSGSAGVKSDRELALKYYLQAHSAGFPGMDLSEMK
jgi:TPR repeat protein